MELAVGLSEKTLGRLARAVRSRILFVACCISGIVACGASSRCLRAEETLSPAEYTIQYPDYYLADNYYLADSSAADPPDDGKSVDAGDLDKLLDLADKDVSQLSNVRVGAPALQTEVTTVSRQTSTIGRSPAAVFVITNEMIRRSGARCIPEVLRMAPGVQVAHIDANMWAISIRGFNGRFANKLLVQIDGRSVYTPLYGGVFWDVQDVLLEDVERIEVIRGPGATVWGANAVNGVINIITKSACETGGQFVEGGAGTEERGFVSARHGGSLGKDGAYRVYAKWFDRDKAFSPGGTIDDAWYQTRAGFRTDMNPSCCDLWTVQGDYYNGAVGAFNIFADPVTQYRPVQGGEDVTGGNILTRWTHTIDDESDWALQLYFDRTERRFNYNPAFLAFEDRNTFDVDFQHRFPIADRHALIWGLGYRNTADETGFTPWIASMTPPGRTIDLFSYFAQDEITLEEDLWYLTMGAKFHHSDFTSFEYQPTARLLWTPSERHSIWASVSRAVRLPTRGDDDATYTFPPSPLLPGVFPQVRGSRTLESEDLLAYEAGIRVQPTDKFWWDLAVFFNDYTDLIGYRYGALEPIPPPPILPMYLTNNSSAQTYGYELAAHYDMTDRWSLHGSYSFLRTVDLSEVDPRNQVYLQSSWDVGCHWQLDCIWRYVDTLPAAGVGSYNVMDIRLAWLPTKNVELAVVGRNLLDAHHKEFRSDQILGTQFTEVEREVYGMATLRF
jgi:iron complex outermembrane receptor protein